MDNNQTQEEKRDKVLTGKCNIVPVVSISFPDTTQDMRSSEASETVCCEKQELPANGVLVTFQSLRFSKLTPSSSDYKIKEGDEKVVRDHTLLNKISGYITNWEDILTLGLALHSDPHDVRRLRNQSHSVKTAAYDVMSAFYDRSSNVTEMWETLIQALRELGLNKAVVDLGLDKQAGAEAEAEADRA